MNLLAGKLFKKNVKTKTYRNEKEAEKKKREDCNSRVCVLFALVLIQRSQVGRETVQS